MELYYNTSTIRFMLAFLRKGIYQIDFFLPPEHQKNMSNDWKKMFLDLLSTHLDNAYKNFGQST